MASTASTTSPKQRFLETYEQEHEKTMRVLRAYPVDQAEFRPNERCKSARELAWIFAIEPRLGSMVVFNDAFATGIPSGKPPEAPGSWEEVLGAVEQAHKEFADRVRSMPDEKLEETSKFMTAPKTLGDVRRLDFLWFLLHDEIHHRGQFSVYLRAAGGRVPSIYGPSEHEPWL
ncbi:MAG: DinB family protein [Gemmatimonadaceae bacterium]